ncbi:MAG: dihydropteroate synthase-like protein [Thermoprotei archaeon]|nr:MAG: dihydropteroate synthase-like protein [Thermoprotei archaeon]
MGGRKKVLLITSRLAHPVVKEVVDKAIREGRINYDAEVLALPIDVAALMTTDYIADYLRRLNISSRDYDVIVVPGLARGSCRIIEDVVGIKAVKGTIYASDIPALLTFDLSKLSSDEAADRVVKEYLRSSAAELLARIENEVPKRKHLRIGNVLVPTQPPPMRVIAEVTEAHLLSKDALLKRVLKLIEEGADMVSVGFEAGNPHPDKVGEVVKFLKREVAAPIAIDTVIPSEILEGVKAGADLVLSLTRENIPKVAEVLGNVAAVVIPQGDSGVPSDPLRRPQVLEDNIALARKYGVENIIADLILDPPGSGTTLKSLISYYEFKQKHPEVPILMGIGNVAEFIDADSVGVNALLTILALEVGASLLLTVEKSTKAQGSTLEVATASQMASIAWVRESPPKDLGIDLLILKDKTRVAIPLTVDREVRVINVGGEVSEELRHTGLDPMGIFKIRVNYDDEVIEALYVGRKGRILIRGKNAKSILNYILENKLVSKLSHAAYLGSELTKAEEALRIHKNYVQEEPLFKEKKYLRPGARKLK